MSRKTIVLDPGHGSDKASDRGFYGSKPDEHEGVNNYLTCLAIKEYLEGRHDVDVLLTRRDVNDNPWPGRGKMYGPVDLFYSRHSNAYDGTVRGTEIWLGSGSATGKALATELCATMAKAFGHRNRGVKNGDGYQVVSEAKAAGVKIAMLVEIGFHDNPEDAKIMTERREEIAQLEGMIIAKHLALPPRVKDEPVAPPGDLDAAQRWAVDNGIAADRHWNDTALTKHTLVWVLYDFYKLLKREGLNK